MRIDREELKRNLKKLTNIKAKLKVFAFVLFCFLKDRKEIKEMKLRCSNWIFVFCSSYLHVVEMWSHTGNTWRDNNCMRLRLCILLLITCQNNKAFFLNKCSFVLWFKNNKCLIYELFRQIPTHFPIILNVLYFNLHQGKKGTAL